MTFPHGASAVTEKGKLYVVATPIGNIEDITLRAITVLKEVQLIAAEDTRRSKILLQHYGIATPLLSIHAHNEQTQSKKILELLTNNQAIAYITDAGTPLISDPGAFLVKTARENGFPVIPIPGPCAAITALSVSGFPSPQFYFEGFLPNKSSTRIERLRKLKELPCTLVFYEAPHRIMGTLEDILKVMNNREGIIARELTKKFETIYTGKLQDIILQLESSPEQRLGEFVILLAGNYQEIPMEKEKIESVMEILLKELSVKQSVVIASKLLGIKKNTLYDIALALCSLKDK